MAEIRPRWYRVTFTIAILCELRYLFVVVICALWFSGNQCRAYPQFSWDRLHFTHNCNEDKRYRKRMTLFTHWTSRWVHIAHLNPMYQKLFRYKDIFKVAIILNLKQGWTSPKMLLIWHSIIALIVFLIKELINILKSKYVINSLHGQQSVNCWTYINLMTPHPCSFQPSQLFYWHRPASP